MDYQISKNKSKEIIVVMPDGSVVSDEEMMEYRRLVAVGKERRKEKGRAGNMVSDEHLNYFVNDLIPFVENKYRILRESRNVAGLSIGGAQTLNLITSHPEMFKAADMFSSGPTTEARDRLPQVKDQIKNFEPIYVSCCSWDSILGYSRTIHNILAELQIKHYYKITDDGGHFWSVWQRNLTEFVSYL